MKKWKVLFFFIIITAIALRFFRIPQNLVFHGELGDNYLAIKNFWENGQIPLMGPPTSHPWLSFGPLFYWLFEPILILSNFNPVGMAYFIAATQVLLVIVNFFVIKKLFNKKIALISSYLIAISPSFINLTRESRFFSLTTLFFYPFLYYLVKLKLFLAGLFFGIMLNFHLTPIVLLPGIAIYLFKKKVAPKQIFRGILGFVIPNMPFLIYSFEHKFSMMLNFLSWIPYRVAGFAGLYPKNNFSLDVLKKNLVSLFDFVGFNFVPSFKIIVGVGILLILLFSLYRLYKVKTKDRIKKNPAFSLLILFFVFSYLGIFIHGDPPSHYYLPIFSLPLIFVAIILEKSRKVAFFILLLLTIINLSFFFSDKWFYLPQDKVIDGRSPYIEQLETAKNIIKDSKGEKFSLRRVGAFDYFEGNYAQNYKYLLWWLGNEPQDASKVTYTIYEKEGESVYFSRSSD